MPVPAGISLPMITFSFRPTSESLLAEMAASVRTRVVVSHERTGPASDRVLLLLAPVVGDDDDPPTGDLGALGLLDPHPAGRLRDRGDALRDARLEQLGHTRQTVRDVLTRDTAGVE